MKKIILTALAALAVCTSAMAQKTSAEYLNKYNTLVKNLGPSGVGIENLINKWEADFPDDVDMLTARFVYYFAKSQYTQVVTKSQDKFMGMKPVLSLKDTTGNDVHYYQENFYVDSLYALSSSAIDKAIKVAPERLDLRLEKVSSLMAYEKESPDMALSMLKGIIDYNASAHPKWKYGSEAVSAEDFSALIQDECAALYSIGSPAAYNAFKAVSEKMLNYEPKNVMFLDNLGTYEFVVSQDHKKALKYYNKVLKIAKDDYTAIKNCVLMARKDKNWKMEKKYLEMLIKCSPDEAEKKSAQARIDAVSQKK